MSQPNFTLPDLWATVDFKPNDAQKEAILHTEGPLYLPAGPGSGKTRVLLWRTVNLIVFQKVSPEDIYLSTFTEKAALQLQEGLRMLLGLATNYSNVQHDISKMYIGTVHSLCRRLISDRRFSPNRSRTQLPSLMDEITQYFHLARRGRWRDFTYEAGFGDDCVQEVNEFFGKSSQSKFQAVQNVISLFNRFSEEVIDPDDVMGRAESETLEMLLEMYKLYKRDLTEGHAVPLTDLSLLQQKALETLDNYPASGSVFKHVIIDEYQDTNTIQERLFFKMAEGHKNICVVGDDDQALYRFRGATVENFVEFQQRCVDNLGLTPRKIPLATNYRSRKEVVDFYTDFMKHCDWRKADKHGEHYRVIDKDIQANSTDEQPAVVATQPGKPAACFDEIAGLIRDLVDQGKVSDPNQVAFLFPSLKSTQVPRMKEALEAVGFAVYAPRAGRFIEVDEAVAMFGAMFQVIGKPARGDFPGQDYNDFHDWIASAYDVAAELSQQDPYLAQFIEDKRAEIKRVVNDYRILTRTAEQRKWDLKGAYSIAMKRVLTDASGLSKEAKASIGSAGFEDIVKIRQAANQPFTLDYILNRATSLDWTMLDLFYRLSGFDHFRAMLDLAENGKDEGPICNLGLISQYLARFVEEQRSVITAQVLTSNLFTQIFGAYLYILFRMGESEYEDAEDPFPKGRIPFLTIHQSKGLEFPVVVLPTPRKDNKGPQFIERVVRPLLDRDGEPLSRSAEFDIMRMFYVALSRAENLLVLGHLSSQGNRVSEPFKTMLADGVTRIKDFDLTTLPAAKVDHKDLPKNYSYTGDYLLYQKCPRQYMIFRKYGFVPSRSQIMFFGSLVHRTLEDLHQHLIARKEAV